MLGYLAHDTTYPQSFHPTLSREHSDNDIASSMFMDNFKDEFMKNPYRGKLKMSKTVWGNFVFDIDSAITECQVSRPHIKA